MEKKVYMMPLIEVEKINLSSAVLVGSPDGTPVPPPGPSGAPKYTTPEVF